MTRFVDYFDGIQEVRRYINRCIIGGRPYYKVFDSIDGEEDYKYVKTHLSSMYGLICQNKDYKKEIGKIIDSHFLYKNDFELLMTSDMFRFYVLRLSVVYKYGLVQARELVKMICRCAFNDSQLTDKESICIIETCLDPQLDNILMEVNYNEGW